MREHERARVCECVNACRRPCEFAYCQMAILNWGLASKYATENLNMTTSHFVIIIARKSSITIQVTGFLRFYNCAINITNIAMYC